MLRITCTNCQKVIECDQQYAGEHIQCPACQSRVLVPFDAPDIDKLQAGAAARELASAPPVPAEIVPAKLDDLIELQKVQHQELCQQINQLATEVRSSTERLYSVTRGVRSNTTIIGLVVVLVALPLMLIGGCGVMAIGTAISSDSALVDSQEYLD